MARTRRRKRKAAISRELDPARWAYFIFVLGGFVGAWLLTNLIEDSWAILWGVWPQHVPRADEFLSNVSGIAIALVGTIIAIRNRRWFKFLTEVVVEISQVTWPSRAEVRAATGVVIIITLISSVILAGMDTVWSSLTDLLYGI